MVSVTKRMIKSNAYHFTNKAANLVVLERKMTLSKIDQIKARYFLPNYIAKITCKTLKKVDNYYITFCPFCQKDVTIWRKRSFWVNENVCGCYNPKCQGVYKPMDIINFYSRYYGVTNSEAIRYLFEGV